MRDSGTESATPVPELGSVVVTGAAGWLGENLLRTLVTGPDEIRALVRDEREAALVDVLGASVTAVIGDVRDPASIGRLFDGAENPVVFHTAGMIHPSGGVREFFDVNTGGTEIVLDAAKRAGATRVVHVSSNSPFGANPTPGDVFNEDSPFNPYMGYGASKFEAEQIVQRHAANGDLHVVIVRPPWFYGPWQPARQTQFLRTVRRGRFPMVGDGSQRRSMVYTGNLVAGMLCAATADVATGSAYWIADAEPYAFADIFASIREAFVAEGFPVTEGKLRIPRIAGVVAEAVDRRLQGFGKYSQAVHVMGELKDTIACDISRARTEIGYDPKVSIVEGMRASIRWCVEHGEAL
ncbi:MAG: NAD-dependent epimerase/dehydratase family protein [Actinobacteria bacterium]|nr:NAD-dependent epimerase/dehydratase family protein [Actinomycetota bacterium]